VANTVQHRQHLAFGIQHSAAFRSCTTGDKMLHVRGAVTGALGGFGFSFSLGSGGYVCKKVLKRSEAAIYLHLHLTSLAVCQKGVKCQATDQTEPRLRLRLSAPLLMAATVADAHNFLYFITLRWPK